MGSRQHNGEGYSGHTIPSERNIASYAAEIPDSDKQDLAADALGPIVVSRHGMKIVISDGSGVIMGDGTAVHMNFDGDEFSYDTKDESKT